MENEVTNMLDDTKNEFDRREHLRTIGAIKSEKKAFMARENGKRGGGYEQTPETLRKKSEAQKRRWELYRQNKALV